MIAKVGLYYIDRHVEIKLSSQMRKITVEKNMHRYLMVFEG